MRGTIKYIIGLSIAFAGLNVGAIELAQNESSSVPQTEISGREALLSIVSGEWVAQSLYAAAQLDIAGHLLSGPKQVKELAKLTETQEESLYRLLRLLASVDIFHEEGNQVFSNTCASEFLAKDHPQSLRSLILFYSQEMSQSWKQLSACLKEGKPAFDLSFGQPVFTYFREHPQSALLFQSAMKEKSRAVIASCLQSYPFKQFSSFYDIGGGSGHFLSAVLNQHPAMKGTLFELPEVTLEAQRFLEPFGQRCTVVAGDFFQQVPANGDAYLLKSVLHDWNDADALRILEKCRESMPDSSKLLIIEPILTAANQKDPAKMMDVYMMVITGGKERTEQDFRRLLSTAGFSVESVTPTETEFYIIQASKTR
jgi:hypothetical protein